MCLTVSGCYFFVGKKGKVNMKTWTKLFAGSAVLALTSGAFATAVPTVANAASKPTKITFWHAMTGNYAKALDDQIKAFNASQSR